MGVQLFCGQPCAAGAVGAVRLPIGVMVVQDGRAGAGGVVIGRLVGTRGR